MLCGALLCTSTVSLASDSGAPVIKAYDAHSTPHALKGLRGKHNVGAYHAHQYYKEFSKHVALTDEQRHSLEASIMEGSKVKPYRLRGVSHENSVRTQIQKDKAVASFKKSVEENLSSEQLLQANAFYQSDWAQRVDKKIIREFLRKNS